MLLYAYKNIFLDIFPWPNFFQAYCALIRSNMVYIYIDVLMNYCHPSLFFILKTCYIMC